MSLSDPIGDMLARIKNSQMRNHKIVKLPLVCKTLYLYKLLSRKNSDISFLMPNIKEAGPENIVPTSSTTAQLALGDAIAVACMRYKNFSKECVIFYC